MPIPVIFLAHHPAPLAETCSKLRGVCDLAGIDLMHCEIGQAREEGGDVSGA
jgi:hypothetical protein